MPATVPEAITAVLARPGGRWVEAGASPAPALPADAAQALALRSVTILELPVASMVAAALAEQHGLPRAVQDDIFTALQEALVNAVVHGNFGIGSAGRDGDAGHADFFTLVQRGMDDPITRALPVVIAVRATAGSISIAVADQGSGDVRLPSADALATGQAHGRGLALVMAVTQACHWESATRSLVMRFGTTAA